MIEAKPTKDTNSTRKNSDKIIESKNIMRSQQKIKSSNEYDNMRWSWRDQIKTN